MPNKKMTYKFPNISKKSLSYCSPIFAILLFSLLSCLHVAGITAAISTAIADFFVVHLGTAVIIDPSATDPDGDTISFSYSDWMSSSNYTTSLGDAGTHSVTVTASDGSLTDSRNVTVNVNYYSQATLTWDANTESDLSGYRLYYGTSSGNYSNSEDAGNKTSHSLSGLKSGQTYYIVARAYDSSGNESDDSSEIVFTAPLFSDADGDDFPDNQEAFPADPGEWLDTDLDGIGNNTDTDDDNDSMDDTWEVANGLDPLDDGSVNIDNGPNGDIDNDGIYNLQEYLASIP